MPKISELPNADVMSGAEWIPIEQDGIVRRVAASLFSPGGSSSGSVARKFTQSLAGSSASYLIVHDLGTQDVTVAVRLAASPFALVECDAQATSTNTVTLTFAVAPIAGAYRVVIIG